MEQEDIVWNAITNNAKRKFDFEAFANTFNEIDESIAENILFRVIASFAGDKTEEFIVQDLFNQMILTGFMWDIEDIKTFLVGKKELLKGEIFAAQIAFNLIEDGNEPLTVLSQIHPLLN
ncbi:MAG: hypothetical protein GC192_15255 [Bacteroidetes bacterium]|nr:hypothetical protein [Bacteroidota bacterium]